MSLPVDIYTQITRRAGPRPGATAARHDEGDRNERAPACPPPDCERCGRRAQRNNRPADRRKDRQHPAVETERLRMAAQKERRASSRPKARRACKRHRTRTGPPDWRDATRRRPRGVVELMNEIRGRLSPSRRDAGRRGSRPAAPACRLLFRIAFGAFGRPRDPSNDGKRASPAQRAQWLVR